MRAGVATTTLPAEVTPCRREPSFERAVTVMPQVDASVEHSSRTCSQSSLVGTRMRACQPALFTSWCWSSLVVEERMRWRAGRR